MNINKIEKNITRILTFEKKVNQNPYQQDSASDLWKDLLQDYGLLKEQYYM